MDLSNEDRIEVRYCVREAVEVETYIVDEGDDVRWVDVRREANLDDFLEMLRTRGLAVVRFQPHAEDAHHLLSPDDVPRHLREHHGVEAADVETRIDPDDYLVQLGIESTGDHALDCAVVRHERDHGNDE